MADRYAFGAFVLDTGARELRRNHQLIALTPKAFDLLQVLAASGGVALDKRALMKSVWPDSYVGEETLTQNISTLRRALGDVAEHPNYIVTVPRHGYRFVAAVQIVAAVANADVPAMTAPAARARDARLTPGAVLVIAVLIVAVGVIALVRARPAPAAAAVARFEIAPPPGTVFNPSASYPAVSPDGRTIALLAGHPGEDSRIWIRPLNSLIARELPGTAGALAPFWSPDSRFLAFFSKGSLKKIGVSGEPPQVLCEAISTVLSGTWHSNGVILFSGRDGIYRTSASGGGVSRVTTVSSRLGETAHVLPQFLPDGRHFLYTARLAVEGSYESWIVLRSLDAADDRRLFSAASQAAYAGGDELLFLRSGTLHVQRFDVGRLAVKGNPIPVADVDTIGANPASPRGMFGVSNDAGPAILAYRAAPAAELTWFDRRGMPLGRLGKVVDRTPAISHDGTRVAVTRVDNVRGTRAIWILDVDHEGVAAQLTSGRWDSCPAWSPDDGTIVFASGVPTDDEIFEKTVGADAAARVAPQHASGCPMDWSSDGRYVLYAAAVNTRTRANGLWLLPMGRPDPVQLLDGTAPAGPRSAQGRLSPNGRWLAYEADQAGRPDILVRAFPDGTRTWQVSTGGGIEPQWRADGKELFFLASNRKLMSAPVRTDGEFQPAAPVALFQTELDAYGIPISGRNQYVASPDGRRFLLKQTPPDAPPSAITVVMNWRAMVK
jgi:DNA-binding winged helix-turn-helix (wHTH) protein/Tol biopolymer transport system component